MSVKLSDRLQAAYDMVSEGSLVADVGCDHAFLSIALVLSKKSPEVFACDVNEGPLEKAGQNIASAGLSEQIHTVLSDGLRALKPPVDSVVICGMGGSLVIHILEQSLEKVRATGELILSPQSDIGKVRMWLKNHSFSLIEERAVIDAGKYYCIIKAAPSEEPEGWEVPGISGDETLDRYVMEYGPYLIKTRDKVFEEYLKKKSRQIEEILKKLDDLTDRYKELNAELHCVGIFLRRRI